MRSEKPSPRQLAVANVIIAEATRADVEYVRLLYLAATTSERRVEATLRAKLDAGDPCDYAAVQAQVRPPVPTIPVVHVPRPDLAQYDALLSGGLHG